MKRVSSFAHTYAGHIETSLACREFPDRATFFYNELQTEFHGIRRQTLSRLFQLAANHPNIAATIINRHLPTDMSYANAGRFSIVYRQGADVIKVYKDTLHLDEDSRQAIAEKENKQQDHMRTYLGALVAPQIITVGPHPASPKRRAVQARQAYFDYYPLDDIFTYHEPTINEAALYHWLDVAPHLKESFYNFAIGGLLMIDKTPYAPDVSGRGNIGIATVPNEPEKLLLIDSQPSKVTDSWVQNYVKPQLEHLQRLLEPAHAV